GGGRRREHFPVRTERRLGACAARAGPRRACRRPYLRPATDAPRGRPARPCPRSPALIIGASPSMSGKYDPRMPPRKKAVRRKKVEPASAGLSAAETKSVESGDLDRLAAQVEDDGGAVLGRYADPFGGTPILLAALPGNRVEPTPYQRDASDTPVKRLMPVIETLSPLLYPI